MFRRCRGPRTERWCLPRSPAFRRNLAAAASKLKHSLSTSDLLHGFQLQKWKELPELKLAAFHLCHQKTGAEYLHIAREDTNNVFSIGFKTNPPDDTGLPHILEHVTLCGSQRYPVRDPFFRMLNRSLSNFMNAFTSSDYTTYPFATTNAKDYKNLRDVYLDATLCPLLKEQDFLQEGWRIGPSAGSIAVPEYKGVVYNEMKGQMSDASYLYLIRFQNHIFPAIHNSGGDPSKIPDLTVDELRAFHRRHYHPSNSKVFTYGDIQLTDHLINLNAKFSEFDYLHPASNILLPRDIVSAERATVSGPVDPLTDRERQYKASVSWILNDTSDVHETFALSVLCTLLTDGVGSPFYRGLIETGIGPVYSPNTGYDTSARKAIFSIGLEGIHEHTVDLLQDTIRQILQQTYKQGFEISKVEGILHQIDLSLKHKTSTFGVSLMQRILPGWFNGVDPFESLKWNETLKEFRSRVSSRSYLTELLKRYLLHDNTLLFVMKPSTTFEEDLAKAESDRLLVSASQIHPDAAVREQILQSREAELKVVQDQAREQNLDCLPTLSVDDISRSIVKRELKINEVDGVPTQWRAGSTNGLTYFRAISNLTGLPEQYRQYLPLFTQAMFKLGTMSTPMPVLEDQIKLKTGGLSCDVHTVSSLSSLDKYEEGLVFSGYCLDQNVPAMFELLQTLLTETNFDNEGKFKNLVEGLASGQLNGVAETGHAFAQSFASAHLTPSARISELTNGLTQVKLITDLASKGNFREVLDILKGIAKFAASRKHLRAAITCSSVAAATNEKLFSQFLTSLPAIELPLAITIPWKPHTPSRSYFPLPFQVSYAALGFRTVPYIHPDGAALQVLSHLLAHRHMHHEVREKGGAYGAGAYHRDVGGIFGLYSYRDPNIINTLEVMSKAGYWASSKQWSQTELDEAKLSIFQALDAPVSISEEGMPQFLHGISDSMRQRRREQLIDVTAVQVQSVAQNYLAMKLSDEEVSLCVLGPSQPFSSAENHKWLTYNISVRAHDEVYPRPLDQTVSKIVL